ncbi:hypothetical protein Hanom_Chr10g00904671 [Helianthus anomalus]
MVEPAVTRPEQLNRTIEFKKRFLIFTSLRASNWLSRPKPDPNSRTDRDFLYSVLSNWNI